MNLDYLIQILQNKITVLNNARNMAFNNGDIETINAVDKQLFENQSTLAQLQLLLTATQAANANNSDLSTLVSAGVEAAQSAVVVPADPTTVINGYDLASYAEDPLYEEKIRDMLSTMPVMDTTVAIDAYINREVVGSPLSGQMIFDATTRYAVDTRLAMAIMELDSRFGTAGVGAVTNNPGNVGNTGSATHTYASWADGVAAVASWLNRHRVAAAPTPVPVVVEPPPVPDPVDPVVDVPPPTPVTVTATSTPSAITPDTPTATTTTTGIAPETTASTTPNVASPATTTPDVVSMSTSVPIKKIRRSAAA